MTREQARVYMATRHATFRSAKGIRTFVLPTFYPPGDPNAGKKADKTMTFIYGAVEVPKSETIYGRVAKETLSQEGSSVH